MQQKYYAYDNALTSFLFVLFTELYRASLYIIASEVSERSRKKFGQA